MPARSMRPDSEPAMNSTKATKRPRTTRGILLATCCGKITALTTVDTRMPSDTSVSRVTAEVKTELGLSMLGMPISAAV